MISNNLIILNKVSKEKKENLKNRVLISISIFLYFALVIVFSFLADSTSSKWSEAFLPDLNIRSIFAFLFLFLIFVPLALSIYEINNLIFKGQKTSFFILLVLSMVFYFGPNSSYIVLKYYSKLLSDIGWINSATATNTISLFISIIVASIVASIIASNILLKCLKVNTFKNVITLNFLMILIPFGFMSLCFLGLVRSWIVLLFVLMIVWATDTFCYFSGLLFGRHKMAPIISPNKTWEGAIGGGTSAFLFVLLFVYLLTLDTKYFSFDVLIGIKDISNLFQWLYITFISILMILFSIMGDILFSYIKRAYKIKDYGSTLKSHGGVLDRFDSIIFSTSVFTLGLFFITAISSSTLFE
ncbi:MAG: phosphatidate cytidylyltransferase [Malacoplasma sp.]